MARIARKHELYEVALAQLQPILQQPNIEVLDAFAVLRIRRSSACNFDSPVGQLPRLARAHLLDQS